MSFLHCGSDLTGLAIEVRAQKTHKLQMFQGASTPSDPPESAWWPPNIGIVLQFQYKSNISEASRLTYWEGLGEYP